jgi:PAS domain S-box-containing protein
MRHEGHKAVWGQAPSVVALIHSKRWGSTLAALLAELDPTTMSVVVWDVDAHPVAAAAIHDVIRAAGFSIAACSDGAVLETGHAYVTRSDWRVWFEGRCLRVGLTSRARPFSFDRVLDSLAAAWGKRSRVLTAEGLVGDGERGLAAVQRAGGLVLTGPAWNARGPASTRRASRDAGDAPPSSRATRIERSSSPPFRVRRLFPFSEKLLEQLQAAAERAVRRAEDRDRVRVWLPRCKTGGLVYGVAMLLRDVTALAAPRRVQVFGTDHDEEALAVARAARYPTQAALGLHPALRARYTVDEDDAIRMAESLRESCVFSPHKLAQSPPFSRMDMIVCHRVFEGVSRTRRADVVDALHFALRDEGELVALDHSHYFHDDRFELTPEGHLRRRPVNARAQRGSRPRPDHEPRVEPTRTGGASSSPRDLEAVLASLPAGVSIHDEHGVVRHGGPGACEGSNAPGNSAKGALVRLYSEAMPSWVERVLQTGERVHDLELSVDDSGHTRFWICQLAPIRSLDGSVTGVTSAVHDITSLKQGAGERHGYVQTPGPAPDTSVLESHIEQLRDVEPSGRAGTGL